jgi:ABC-2 type transport system permease protein
MAPPDIAGASRPAAALLLAQPRGEQNGKPANQLALLLRHEARLIWRGSLFGGKWGWALIIGLGLLVHAIGYGVALGFTKMKLAQADQVLGATLALLFVGGLMLSQAVQRATELLDDRTDLGWLLSTPVPPRHILTVRLMAVAGAVSLYWLLLLVPLADGMAMLGRRDLLGITPMLVALALLVTSAGFGVTFALLRVTGLRRTRALANAFAAVIGGTVFLAGQSRAVFTPAVSDRFWHSFTPTPEAALHSVLWMPARALLGAPVPMLLLMVIALTAALATSWSLQMWFAAGAQAVVAGNVAASALTRADRRPFRAGVGAALLVKEIKLLRRYPGLTGLAAYYLIYLVPAVTTIWHSAGHAQGAAGDGRLLGAAPVLSAGELARLFVSVTIMGDDAAELVRTAPVRQASVHRAKLAAASLGVFTILGLPVLGLAVSIPSAIPAMMMGLCGNVGCNLLLGLWRPAPIRRSDLRRNHKGWGGLVNVAGFFFSSAWSVATWQALKGSWWALLPIGLALVALRLCKPADEDAPALPGTRQATPAPAVAAEA